MALVTERFRTLRSGWLTCDVTYDDVTERIEQIHVECHSPVPVDVAIYRQGQSSNPWRETTMNDGEVYDESRPFGGGIKDLSDLDWFSMSVEF